MTGQDRLRSIWGNMRTRCNNTKSNIYKWYGGRGINVCKDWSTFKGFEEWAIHNGYDDSLELDRIDVNGDYCPQNCRFIAHKENANNRRSNNIYTYDGQTKTMAEWAEWAGMNYDTLMSRIHELGWDLDKAITTPVRVQQRNENSIAFLARAHGLSPDTVRKRIKRYGWSLEQALSNNVS